MIKGIYKGGKEGDILWYGTYEHVILNNKGLMQYDAYVLLKL